VITGAVLSVSADWRNNRVTAKFPPMLNGATKQEIQKLFETLHPPELGPGPRPDIKSEAELRRSLAKLSANSEVQPEQWELIVALVLLWHDHLDSAHEIAQEIANTTGSFVHGIMHRREPDYGNAAYWFRRVGKHPAFAEIAERASKALEAKGNSDLTGKLIPAGEWDPFAFIAACERAASTSIAPMEKELMRELQVIETSALFDWLCNNRW
jgi:hypothetical protein